MEWIERLNQSMLYIEEHLTDEVDNEQLGRIVRGLDSCDKKPADSVKDGRGQDQEL